MERYSKVGLAVAGLIAGGLTFHSLGHWTALGRMPRAALGGSWFFAAVAKIALDSCVGELEGCDYTLYGESLTSWDEVPERVTLLTLKQCKGLFVELIRKLPSQINELIIWDVLESEQATLKAAVRKSVAVTFNTKSEHEVG